MMTPWSTGVGPSGSGLSQALSPIVMAWQRSVELDFHARLYEATDKIVIASQLCNRLSER